MKKLLIPTFSDDVKEVYDWEVRYTAQEVAQKGLRTLLELGAITKIQFEQALDAIAELVTKEG